MVNKVSEWNKRHVTGSFGALGQQQRRTEGQIKCAKKEARGSWNWQLLKETSTCTDTFKCVERQGARVWLSNCWWTWWH